MDKSEPNRLEGGGRKGGEWVETAFGDRWHDKCITLWCVVFEEGFPEDDSIQGPGNGLDVWVYTIRGEAQQRADELNRRQRICKNYKVKVAAVVKHGDEDAAEAWLKEKGLVI